MPLEIDWLLSPYKNNEINKMNIKRVIKRDLRIYISFSSIFILYFIYSLFIKKTIDLPELYLTTLFIAGSITLSLASFFYFILLIFRREKRPLRKFIQVAIIPFKRWDESINLVLILILIAITFSFYTDVKSSIPDNNPFYLDPLLIKYDDFLHFGIPPWKITHHLFSTPLESAIINLFYNLWFFICWIFLIVFSCLYKKTKLRQDTLISFILCWTINGSIAATLFSSVGPCFYDIIYQDSDLFNELILILKQQNAYLENQGYFLGIWSLNTQNMLLESYLSETSQLGSGISAMPSMHVSMATLMALATYSLKKWVGLIFWLYMILIMIGSVHLGWHYAVDGYIGALMTIAIWIMVSKLLPKKNETI